MSAYRGGGGSHEALFTASSIRKTLVVCPCVFVSVFAKTGACASRRNTAGTEGTQERLRLPGCV